MGDFWYVLVITLSSIITFKKRSKQKRTLPPNGKNDSNAQKAIMNTLFPTKKHNDLRFRHFFCLIVLLFFPLISFSQDHYQTGVCSYYGKKFHGRKTANGETFDMYAMTAAHKGLPFNTQIKVTNLKNNKSVIVRINDRGPYIGKRILDLSYGAAREIGLGRSGVGKVTIETYDYTPPQLASEEQLSSYVRGKYYYINGAPIKLKSGYGIQIISFSLPENLTKHYKKLVENGYRQIYTNLAIKGDQRVYEIRLGKFKSKKSAEKYRKKFLSQYTGTIVRKY